MADAVLAYDIFARDRGATVTINKVGDAFEDVDKKSDHASKSVHGLNDDLKKVGASSKSASEDLKKTSDEGGHLTKEFTRAKQEVARLTAEFDKSGDHALFKELRKEQANVSRMSKLLKGMGDDSQSGSDRSVTAMARMGQALTSLGGLVGAAFSNPWVIGIGAVMAALVALGALAASAGLALVGLGAGMVGLGALAVRNSAAVQKAFAELSDSLTTTFDNAGQVMERPIVEALNTIRQAIGGIGPDLKAMFTAVAPSVHVLAEGLAGLIQNVMPGLRRAVEACRPAFEAFGNFLPEIGTALSHFFDSLANAGPGAVKAMLFALQGLMTGLEALGEIIEFSAKAFDFLDRVSQVVSGNLGGLAAESGAAAVKQGGLKDSSSALSGAIKALGDATKETTIWTKGLAAAEGLLNAVHMSSTEATIAAKDAQQQLADSLKASKGSFDINTDAGRRSTSALLQGITAAAKMADAMYEETGNADQSSAAFRRQVAALRAQALSAGASKAQTDRLIGGFVAARGPALSSAAAVQRLNGQIAALKSKQVTAKANGDGSEVARLQRQIDALRGKIVDITVRYRTVGSGAAAIATPSRGHSADRNLAFGGQVRHAAGGTYVGGSGPGTLDMYPYLLAAREFVVNAKSTAKVGVANLQHINRTGQLPTSQGAVINLTVNVNAPNAHPADVGKAAVEAIRQYEKRNGTGWRSA